MAQDNPNWVIQELAFTTRHLVHLPYYLVSMQVFETEMYDIQICANSTDTKKESSTSICSDTGCTKSRLRRRY